MTKQEVENVIRKIKGGIDEARQMVDSVDGSVIVRVAEKLPLIGTWAHTLDLLVDAIDDLADLAAAEAGVVLGVPPTPAPQASAAGGQAEAIG